MARRPSGLRRLLGAGAASLSILATSALAVPTERVATASGPVVGEDAGDLMVYRGVPYAAPPVGPLRWRPPQPHAPWTEDRDARAFGYDCVQTPFPRDSTPSIHTQSEDCLTLNIWSPKALNGPAPVMVWIHGGGFTNGLGSSPVFDGAALARAGVVVVTFNYRLGRFGFFAHPAITADRPAEPKGNYGLMDQVAALAWVRANIAAFGGDPDLVTIFGESAGGASVNALMASPVTRGLFVRAIAESGGLGEAFPCLSEGEAKGVAFAAARGVPDADAEALRGMPLEVVKGDLSLMRGRPETYAGPMVDGRLVTKPIPQAFADGLPAPVPYIAGANSQELPPMPMIADGVAARYEEADRLAIRQAYDPDGGRTQFDAQFPSEALFVAPARRLAGLTAETGAPAWLYRFDVVPAGRRVGAKGAGHASELPYVFGTLATIPTTIDAADSKASEMMRAYWTNFAKTGDPNGPGLPRWPRYGRADDQVLTLRADGAAAGPHPDPARMDLLVDAAQAVCPAP